MASSRTRSAQQNPIGCICSSFGAAHTVTAYTDRLFCNDVIGDYGGNHDLLLRKITTTGSLIYQKNGSRQWPKDTPGFGEGAPSAMYNTSPGLPTSIWPQLSTYVSQLLANTGPLTPRVNVPLFLFELRELPSMIKQIGHRILNPRGWLGNPDKLSKSAASAVLEWNFGWAPLIGDLDRLLEFTKTVDKRHKLLRGAHSSKGIRTRSHLDNRQQGGSGWSQYLWSTYGLSINAPMSYDAHCKVWGVVSWRVRDPSLYSTPPSRSEAFKIAYGLKPGALANAIWGALPWTWLIDWFTGVGNLLKANYNMVFYRPYRLSICRHSVITNRHKRIPVGGGDPLVNYIEAGATSMETKERYANNSPTASLNLKLPYLDSFKLSILGSLSVLKLGRSRS